MAILVGKKFSCQIFASISAVRLKNEMLRYKVKEGPCVHA